MAPRLPSHPLVRIGLVPSLCVLATASIAALDGPQDQTQLASLRDRVELQVGLRQLKPGGEPFHPGERVHVFARASRDGCLSVWNLGPTGNQIRLWPLPDDGRPCAEVAGGQPLYLPNEKGGYEVGGSLGVERMVAVWSATREEHPEGPRMAGGEPLLPTLSARVAVSATTYQTAPARPNPSGAGRVFVLSMGANVENLRHAGDDARRFADFFKVRYGLSDSQIRLDPEVSVRGFREGMRWLKGQVTANDTVVIFFSGHGAKVIDDNGDERDEEDEAFVTTDADTEHPLPSQTIRDDEFAQMVRDLHNPNVITVIDACHSGGLGKALLVGATSKFLSKGELMGKVRSFLGFDDEALDEQELAPGQLVLTASGEHQTAIEFPGSGGAFVTTLLDEMGKAKGKSLVDLFPAVAERVRDRTGGKQLPRKLGPDATGERLRF